MELTTYPTVNSRSSFFTYYKITEKMSGNSEDACIIESISKSFSILLNHFAGLYPSLPLKRLVFYCSVSPSSKKLLVSVLFFSPSQTGNSQETCNTMTTMSRRWKMNEDDLDFKSKYGKKLHQFLYERKSLLCKFSCSSSW